MAGYAGSPMYASSSVAALRTDQRGSPRSVMSCCNRCGDTRSAGALVVGATAVGALADPTGADAGVCASAKLNSKRKTNGMDNLPHDYTVCDCRRLHARE